MGILRFLIQTGENQMKTSYQARQSLDVVASAFMKEKGIERLDWVQGEFFNDGDAPYFTATPLKGYQDALGLIPVGPTIDCSWEAIGAAQSLLRAAFGEEPCRVVMTPTSMDVKPFNEYEEELPT